MGEFGFIKIRRKWKRVILNMSDAAAGELLKGMLKYSFDGCAPKMSDEAQDIFELLLGDLDYDRQRYENGNRG